MMAPEMLGEPKVLTGADNAMRGFNSNAGTYLTLGVKSPKEEA